MGPRHEVEVVEEVVEGEGREGALLEELRGEGRADHLGGFPATLEEDLRAELNFFPSHDQFPSPTAGLHLSGFQDNPKIKFCVHKWPGNKIK